MAGQIRKLFLFLSSLFLLISCGNNKQEQSNLADIPIKSTISENVNYQILKIEPFESDAKSQVKCIAYLTTDTISREILTESLLKIYSELKNYNGFKNYSAPSVIGIYLYTSKEMASNMEASWIAMLVKAPNDNQPKISFDDQKIEALKSHTSHEKSPDEVMLEKLNEYFKKKNTDLCSLYKTLYDIEGATIKEADAKYPNYGAEHSQYQSKLYLQQQKQLFKKFGINDTLSTYITVFGMRYCK